MLLSVVVALILTPVLCASLLKPVKAGHEPAENAAPFLRPFFRALDRVFFRVRDWYVRTVERSFSRKLRYFAVYVLIVAATAMIFFHLPTSYVPDEDQGILISQVMLPTGSTLEQTKTAVERFGRYFNEKEKDAVESVLAVSGIGFSGRAQTNGIIFVKLKDWDLRNRPDLRVKAIAERATGEFMKSRDAVGFAFPPPSVIELGQATGFDFQLVDRGGVGHQKLMEARNQLLGMAGWTARSRRYARTAWRTCPSTRLTWTGRRRAPSASPSPRSMTRYPIRSAAPTSTTLSRRGA
jgi:HAE1 family hydrophobic/amphiphilic exporter-1